MNGRWQAIGALFFSAAVRAAVAAIDARPFSSTIQTLSAHDEPVSLNGATGKLAEWLGNFDVPRGEFSYTKQLVRSSRGCHEYRVVFESSFKSSAAQNDIVPAELYLPGPAGAHIGARIPAAVVLDILAGNGVIGRAVAIGLASRGVAAIYFPMPWFGPRRPPGSDNGADLAADPHHSVDALRQVVMDVRRAKAILAAQPQIDSHRLGITGVSLGGATTVLAAGVDGTFARVLPILAGGDIAALTFTTREMRRVRDILQGRGIDQAELAQRLAPTEPLHFAPRIDPARCLMINASNDEVVPRSLTERLAAAIGGPTVLWVPAGHYSSILHLPTIQTTAASFLRGERVEKLQYGYFTSPTHDSR